MATKIKVLAERQFGHMPMRAFITGDKGKFIATTKVDGKDIVGTGATEAKANQDLKNRLKDLH